jgi:hypothetical protein
MSTKVTVRQPNIDSVAAGSTMTVKISIGRQIHALYMSYNDTDQDLTDFTEIRIFLNGQVIQRFSATERDELNRFAGMGAAAGTLVIPFDRTGLLTVAGAEQTAINTGVMDKNGIGVKSFFVEVDVVAGATIAAADIRFHSKESDAILTDNMGNPYGAGIVPFILREQRTVAGADNDYQISDLVNAGVNAPNKIALSAVHFKPSAGTISNLRVDRNLYKIFDRTDSLNRVIQTAGVRVPIAGLFSIDTTENGHGGELIQLYGLTDYRYILEVSAAATFTIISEYFGALQG